jgi:antitoxin ParD1/3/4
MSKNTSFSLGNHFSAFIEEQEAEGRYGSASDVVRAGLRLLEEEEAKLAALRALHSLRVSVAALRSRSM